MPTLYLLIGIPGSGKSTWVSNQSWTKDAAYVSSDAHIEKYAQSIGKTYNDVFDEYAKTATELMLNDARSAQEAAKDIVWDQTNTSVKVRKTKLNMLPEYRKIAVVFKTPDQDELTRRLGNRPGKNIPDHVMSTMINNLVYPTPEEGFDEIWYAD